MNSKKKQYILGGVALAAVVVAFLAILYVNTTIALIGAFLAIVATILSISMIYFEQEEIDEDRKEMAAGRKSRKE
ncbi:MAG: hypothetical protein KGH64_03165 [Candidatus Micrarchaeota archaeon]|nr:hypothetical protein [Candidatus Micrarchaeota archaeon]MDE1859571.1 hypothetical protein [Candidatus Micrarchaeota archaeon]